MGQVSRWGLVPRSVLVYETGVMVGFWGESDKLGFRRVGVGFWDRGWRQVLGLGMALGFGTRVGAWFRYLGMVQVSRGQVSRSRSSLVSSF